MFVLRRKLDACYLYTIFQVSSLHGESSSALKPNQTLRKRGEKQTYAINLQVYQTCKIHKYGEHIQVSI